MRFVTPLASTVLAAISLVGHVIAEPLAKLQVEESTRVEDVKSHSARQVARLRLTNNRDRSLQFGVRGGKPDLLVAVPDGDSWKWVHWNWCGNGRAEATLRPGASRSWTLDVTRFEEKYGQRLRFGLGVRVPDRDDQGRTDKLHFIWSQEVDLSRGASAQRVRSR